MEVLSPVGSSEMLIAAVRSGADAVYLGAGDFNARRGAENFDDEQLKNAVDYCKIRGVKVYLTLNIVVRDDEMKRAVALAKKAEHLGIDGVIVQDLGLAEILRKVTPNLPLHASTQMSVQSESALALLKEMGFKRVVVAREMSESALEKVCKKAKELDLEIEVFVHGALCMCVSGQCMLSSMLGTRSGNRGLCAGTCRLPFSARGKDDDYALSLKDLSLIKHIEKLKKMGVSSLKIEGRMKRPEYVAIATATVKAAVSGEEFGEKEALLQSVFTRSGFTDGYFSGKIDSDMFGVRTKEDVLKAKDVLPKIHSLYRNERQSVGVKMEFTALVSQPVCLTLDDGENTVTATGEIPQKAQNRPTDEESVKTALKKLGGTPFFAEEIKISLDGGLFISAAALNNLRREATEKLGLARCKRRQNTKEAGLPTNSAASHSQQGFILSLQNKEQLEEITDFSDIYAVVVPAHNPFKVRADTKIFVELWGGIENEETVLKQLKRAKEMGINGAVVHNLAHIPLCLKEGMEMLGGTGLNVYNSFTAEKLWDLGVKTLTLSPEMHIKNARDIKPKAKTLLFAYGNVPLMTVRNCPVKAQIGCENCGKKGKLTDRTGKQFPVLCDGNFARLLNCLPVFLGDKKEDTAPFDYSLLAFSNEDPHTVSQVLSLYRHGQSSPNPFTRGLYYRTVE